MIFCRKDTKEVKTHGYDKAAFFEAVWNLWHRKIVNDSFEQARALRRSMTGLLR